MIRGDILVVASVGEILSTLWSYVKFIFQIADKVFKSLVEALYYIGTSTTFLSDFSDNLPYVLFLPFGVVFAVAVINIVLEVI